MIIYNGLENRHHFTIDNNQKSQAQQATGDDTQKNQKSVILPHFSVFHT